jgi:hypothetical protein
MPKAPAHPEIDEIALGHGQARWLLTHLNLRTGADDITFDSYLKSLRRDGVPFSQKEQGVGAGHPLTYRYEHLMELAVALALRAQAILPRDIVALLAERRALLRKLYRRAYIERDCELGAQQDLVLPSRRPLPVGGVYLDLRLEYIDTGSLVSIEPELIGPVEAIKRFTRQHRKVYPRPPLPISDIATDVVSLAKAAPAIRRGRP